jgi:hypothetical protein
MKQIGFTKILALAFAMTLSTAMAQRAETSTGSTTGTAMGSDTVSAIGMIKAYSQGSDYFAFQADTDKTPQRYYYTKNTTILDPGGRVVTWSAIRADVPAIVYYVPEGNRLVAQKILLRRQGTVYQQKPAEPAMQP